MNRLKKQILYPYVLDYKPGFFLNWVLYKFFTRVKVDENMKETLKQMQREGTVVYANKNRSLLNCLLYHFNFRSRRMPYPKIVFDLNIALFMPIGKLLSLLMSQVSTLIRHGRIPNPYKTGFYSHAIQRGTPALITLVDPKGFIRSFIHSEKDHIHFLIETQKEMSRPIFIVPQLIIYKTTLEKDYSRISNILFGYKDNPGTIRKLVLFFRHHRHAFIDFGRPLDLKAYLEGQRPDRPLPEMASEIRHMLIESVDNQKRIILGPIMKSRQQLKETVLMDQRVTDQMEKLAEGDSEKLRHLRKSAGKHFDEIAADYNTAYVQLFRIALSWLWKKIFDGIDINPTDSRKIREWARKGPLIYIPSHKSHIDYLVLNYVLYDFHMHIPRIAAGQNLAFWPLGHIFRKAGAFFIRRTFRGAKLYSEVFGRYVKALLEEGHPIEFYIEGGRSRNGKLVPPKSGFLSILLQAHNEGFCKDLIFVPTSIIYDRIMEGTAYLKEISGGKKTKENFRQVVSARQFLKKKYGKIYIRFNEPFSLNEYLSQKNNEDNNTPKELAFHLIKSINEVSLVTPLSLVGTAILANHRRGFHISDLTETVNILVDFLKSENVPMAESLEDLSKAVRDTISLLINWKMVDLMEDASGEEETFFFVDDDKKLELEFYKNCIIHFFIYHSFIALSLLTGTEAEKTEESIISDYCYLKDIFDNEFIFEPENLKEKIRSRIQYFLNIKFIAESESGEAYKITKLGFDKLPIWAAMTKTFLESYWIAAKTMSQRHDSGKKGESLLKDMNYMGRRYHKLGVVDHIGALSQINFKNAVDYINKNIINAQKDSGDMENQDTLKELTLISKKLYEMSHYGQIG